LRCSKVKLFLTNSEMFSALLRVHETTGNTVGYMGTQSLGHVKLECFVFCLFMEHLSEVSLNSLPFN
jgi:hypothetical protein